VARSNVSAALESRLPLHAVELKCVADVWRVSTVAVR
jgi:hypothetical protein